MTLLNETGNVAIGISKVNVAVGSGGHATTRKEYEIIPDVDFECGGDFVIFGDGSEMGVLTRTKTATQPGEVSVGIIIPIVTAPTTAVPPETVGFAWKGAAANSLEYHRPPQQTSADDSPPRTRKRAVVLDESDGIDGLDSIFPPSYF